MDPTSSFQGLIIGVGSYLWYADLMDTLTDAQTLYNLLINPKRCGYPPERVRLRQGEDATKDTILDDLAWLARNATPEATTFIYFSGHGGSIEDGPSYLCPREADWRNLSATAITAQTFQSAIQAIHTQRMVVILNACYSGGMAALKGIKGNVQPPQWKSGWSRHHYQQLAQGEGRVVMASSRADQASLMLPEAKLSLFTHYLIKGFEGGAVHHDGLIHVFDLFGYVSTTIKKEHPLQDPIIEAQQATNFPVALYQGGFFRKDTESTGSSSSGASSLSQIRRQIESPYANTRLAGAQALLDYAKQVPSEVQQHCNAVPTDIQTQITNLGIVEHEAEVYGETPQTTAQRLRIIHSFYVIIDCLEHANDDSAH